MLAERLTNVPGSSAYFLGGVVCYSNELKASFAGVPAEIIESKGAVSSEVALALAEGIRKRTAATLGIGITGIAGPGGATPDKPVGLVHIALADERGAGEHALRFPRATANESARKQRRTRKIPSGATSCSPRVDEARLCVSL